MASLSIWRATCGRFSPILTPVTEVAISFEGPPFSWPGLRSNRSMVAGPPDIHNRMQERFRCCSGAAASANLPNQPEAPAPRAPAALSFIQARRDRMGAVTDDLLG